MLKAVFHALAEDVEVAWHVAPEASTDGFCFAQVLMRTVLRPAALVDLATSRPTSETRRNREEAAVPQKTRARGRQYLNRISAVSPRTWERNGPGTLAPLGK